MTGNLHSGRSSNQRQWVIVGAIATLLILLVALGLHLRDDLTPVSVGSIMPEIRARRLNGDSTRLTDLKGQVVLVNVWATWCEPCRIEMPSIERLQRALGPEGLKVVAINVDKSTPGLAAIFGEPPGGDVEGFVKAEALTFEIWTDSNGTSQQRLRTTGVPESFLIDRQGRVVMKQIGMPANDGGWDSPAMLQTIRVQLARK